MRRKNPLAGSTSLGRLIVKEVRLGDDAAVHDVRGQMVFDGDVDTVVLRVKENAEIERLLLVRRLEIGPAAAAGAPTGYPSDGSAPGPRASVDDDGTVRTAGWVVIGDGDKGLVLRSPEGKYFGFTVDDDGRIASQGRFLGYVSP